MDNERRKKLEETLKELNKGKDSTAKFDYAEKSPDKEVIPFGIKKLDDFYGGGIVLRKYTVDFGGEDTGKSTRALHLVASAQKLGKICCYLDMERKFDKDRAKEIGVNLEDLVLSQTIVTAEEAMDAIKAMAEKKVVDLVVVDSIQAMSPKGEQETKKGKKKSIENDEMALLARKLGKFFRTTSAEVFNAKMAVYLIGQVRMNIGGFFAFADLSGGNALKHWMSLCTYSRRGQKPDAPVKKEKKEVLCPDGTTHKKTVTTVLGFDCVLKMVKSHIGDSVREGEDIHLPFYFETGFNAPKNEITEAILSALPNEKEIKKIEKAKPRPITEIKEMVEESIEDLSKVMNVTEAKKELKKLEEPKKKSIKGANPGIIEDIKKTVKTSTAIEGVNIKEEPKKKRGRGRPKKVKNDL